MADLDGKLQSIASEKHTRVALVGMGGIGKSQIAIEYAYRARQRDPKLSVFWVYASNTTRYEQAYRDLADELNLLGRTDPGVDIFKLVSRWLSDAANGCWLMILDNADNEDMFFQEVELGINQGQPKASARPALITSIPQTTNGSVIITSRNSTAARNLLTNHQNILYIDVMEENDALDLIQTRVTLDQGSMEDARRLMQALEYIPLAVVQAGSYIQERLPRTTVSAYLTLLQESDANLVAMLGNMDLRDSRRDYSSQHVVTATWQISFDQIRSSQPTSANLLALMSMFDRQGIPETLLRQDMSRFEFGNVVHPLISFSLIKESRNRQLFQLHRLVQISVRKWLESNGQLQLWTKRSAELMAATFPSGEFGTWTECQNLIPHAKEIMRQDVINSVPSRSIQSYSLGLRQRLKRQLIHQKMDKLPENNKGLLAWATTGFKAGWYLFLQGKYEEAESMHRRALRDREKVLGPEHPDTLVSVNNLGWALYQQGKYDEAAACTQRL
ncbi:P-loop containing nucleoside triphosphate hydrolase protein [Aspergillus terricola var. indicus]